MMGTDAGSDSRILVRFVDVNGAAAGHQLELPRSATTYQLQALINNVLSTEEKYQFHLNEYEITESLHKTLLLQEDKVSTENAVEIVYEEQAVFKVRAVTRCTSTLHGHGEAIINAAFNHNGTQLATGSGDATVRFWDLSTESPLHTCKSHKQWVLVIAWHPTSLYLASGCKKGDVCLWDPRTGARRGKVLTGHKKWISCLAWRPLHCAKDPNKCFLASGSKDGSIKVWDPVLGQCCRSLTSHTQGVTCLKWSGEDLIYSSSQDRTIKVWRPSDGVLCRTLQGHGHWVNTMALSTDYICRIGSWDPSNPGETDALKVYNKYKGTSEEYLVSGSDDFTLFLWNPSKQTKPLARMTGHQQLINQVNFSPNGRTIASASFDKSVKIWDGRGGKFISTLRGHVKAVYQICWSSDNKLLVSASSDSTVKVWCMRTFSLLQDLPGHADEVYTVDWSPDGARVVSGGKDKVLKLWRS